MKNTIFIMRVNPDARSFTKMELRCGNNPARDIAKIVRTKPDRLGHRELVNVNGVTLIVAAALDVDETMTGWRLLGGEDTAGISVLFGKGPLIGGMVNVPIDREWLASRIRWLDGEDIIGTRQRAEDTLPLMDVDVKEAIIMALPDKDGDLWLTNEFQHVYPAFVTLGLGTPSTSGQRLSPLGRAARDLVMGAIEKGEVA